MSEEPRIFYRLSWINGPVFADINKKEVAEACYHMGNESYPGEIKMETITVKDKPETSYGRDEYDE